jgi:hypothetical protein
VSLLAVSKSVLVTAPLSQIRLRAPFPRTWLLAVRVADEELWRQIKAGELTGFSIGGSAMRGAV